MSETTSINNDLLVLGRVITQLSESGSVASYRDSTAMSRTKSNPYSGSSATPDSTGVPEELRPFYEQTLEWTSCGDAMECTTVRAPLDVELTGTLTLGMTVADLRAPAPEGCPTQVAMDLDADRFWNLVIDALERIGPVEL